MDFLIHWPPGPVVATVQCQGLHGNHANLHSNHANWFASFKIMMSIRHVSHLVRHMSHLFQLGETCVSPFSIPGSNTAN